MPKVCYGSHMSDRLLRFKCSPVNSDSIRYEIEVPVESTGDRDFEASTDAEARAAACRLFVHSAAKILHSLGHCGLANACWMAFLLSPLSSLSLKSEAESPPVARSLLN